MKIGNYNVDITGLFYITLGITTGVLCMINIDNLISCWETQSYDVWVCNTIFTKFYLIYLFGLIWIIWTGYIILSMLITKDTDFKG